MTVQFVFIALAMLLGPASPSTPQDSTREISPALLRSLDEFRASLRTWEQTEVDPVMAAWQQQFDASLTKEERAELNALRGNAAHIEMAIYDNLIVLRQARKADNDEADTLEEQLDSLFRARVQTISAAIPFVVSGQSIIDAMQEDMQPAMHQWQAERSRQWEEWLDSGKPLIRSYGDADLVKKLDALYNPATSPDTLMQKRITATRFLLWSGSTTGLAKYASSRAPGTSFVQSLSPNPANEYTVLSLAVPAEGSVLVTLHNARGEVVYIPQNGRMSAGGHTVEIPTARFTSGRYYYTVQVNGVQQNGVFSIVH